MLASTVQFSTNNRPPPTPIPPAPASRRRSGRYGIQAAPEPKQRTPPPRATTTRRRPRPAPSGPNSVPTATTPSPAPLHTPHRSGRQYWKPANEPAAELVSVPPSSTTPHTRRPPETGRPISDVGAALDHHTQCGGQCSLERR